MIRSTLAAFASLSLGGCLVYGGGPRQVAVDSTSPYISYADASCYWDDGYRDYVWWFEADVDDPDGDVQAVYADVYDNWDGSLADSFELYYEGDGTWYSAWQQWSTYLDCEYYDYTVDISAQDSWDNTDVVSFQTW